MSDLIPQELPAPARCEFVIAWGRGSLNPEPTFCGTPATKRYPAMGGGFMHLCDEHSVNQLNYVEDVPR